METCAVNSSTTLVRLSPSSLPTPRRTGGSPTATATARGRACCRCGRLRTSHRRPTGGILGGGGPCPGGPTPNPSAAATLNAPAHSRWSQPRRHATDQPETSRSTETRHSSHGSADCSPPLAGGAELLDASRASLSRYRTAAGAAPEAKAAVLAVQLLIALDPIRKVRQEMKPHRVSLCVTSTKA